VAGGRGLFVGGGAGIHALGRGVTFGWVPSTVGCRVVLLSD
jgi:hypothetical protein